MSDGVVRTSEQAGDAHARLQKAVDACLDGAANLVLLDELEYRIDQSIVVYERDKENHPPSLRGAFPGCRIVASDAFPEGAPMLIHCTPNSVGEVRVSGLTFWGGRRATGVYLKNWTATRYLEDCWFYACRRERGDQPFGSAVHIENGWGGHVRDIRIYGCGGKGDGSPFYWDSTGSNSCSNINVNGCNGLDAPAVHIESLGIRGELRDIQVESNTIHAPNVLVGNAKQSIIERVGHEAKAEDPGEFPLLEVRNGWGVDVRHVTNSRRSPGGNTGPLVRMVNCERCWVDSLIADNVLGDDWCMVEMDGCDNTVHVGDACGIWEPGGVKPILAGRKVRVA